MEPAVIGNYGERHAEEWLRMRGYTCNRNTQLPGSTDIEASSRQANLLVQVKTGLAPNAAPDLPADERQNIVARAQRLSRQAWLARLQIDSRGALVGSISWTQLA